MASAAAICLDSVGPDTETMAQMGRAMAIVLAALLSATAAPAAGQAVVPEPIRARVNEMVAACVAAGGALGNQRGPNGFVIPRDFNGDGRTDFLVTEGGFPCAGAPMALRPQGQARLQLWLGDGAGGARLLFDDRVAGHRLVEGQPATLSIIRSGAACGAGRTRCEDRIQLTRTGVVLVAADGRPGGPVAVAAPAERTALSVAPAVPASAASGASLPLRRGYYVEVAEPCNRASNATVSLFTGTGMNFSRTACTFQKVVQLGPARYRVTESCKEVGGWGRDEPPELSTSIYEIAGDSRFTVRWANAQSRSSRHCLQSAMNEPFRSNDLSDLTR